ncbi:LAQU0S22e00782g1_1 [Lachancea quebecensis]|uniref:LAQU0S22e00782g1_1 n=1 Tax=Lachancea quebecensis TaxID=1654605 RepID=A0A0P1KZM7_9SACH|nr:LAQU0S22e00782g1_1 [Lachancea quebecensis]
MTVDSELISSFSPDAQKFAFKSNNLQRKYVDLYPLSNVNDYKVTSSLVDHIDYESGDLKLDDLKYIAWCSSLARGGAISSKRRNTEVESSSGETSSSTPEPYFVNVFKGGKIVIFSPTGKDIINIIQNKQEILGVGAAGPIIWILDEEKTVKEFDYRSSKPLKTFHLNEGKEDHIEHFELLNIQGKPVIALFTESLLYVIDPSKRRPSTILKLKFKWGRRCIPGPTGCIIVAGSEEIQVVDLKTGSVICKRALLASDIKFCDSKVYALSTEGELHILRVEDLEPTCLIKCQRTKILHFTFVDSSVIIAWLNVNEPKFEQISFKQTSEKNEIIFQLEESNNIHNAKPQEETSGAASDIKELKSKASKDKQNVTLASLIQILEENDQSKKILENIKSDVWSEDLIKNAVVSELSERNVRVIFDTISKEIAGNPWSGTQKYALWFKWLLTFHHVFLLSGQENNSNKKLKQVKSSLRTSSDVYSQLLAMKGKLEMLSEQAKLREEFSRTSLEDEISQPQGSDNAEEKKLVYANGEGDEYVDALEYAEKPPK